MKAKLKPSTEAFGSESLLIYKESLIAVDNKPVDEFTPSGKFGKKILIITDAIASDSEEQILLDKMLKATKLSMQDIFLLKIVEKKPLLPYINKIKPAKIICFGKQLDTENISFSNTLYNIIYINDIQLLVINNLNQIVTSSKAKQALWNGLKKMFDL